MGIALNSQGAMRTFRAPPMLNNHFVHNSNTNGSVIVSKAVTYPDQQVRATWLRREDRARTDRNEIAKTYDSRSKIWLTLTLVSGMTKHDQQSSGAAHAVVCINEIVCTLQSLLGTL